MSAIEFLEKAEEAFAAAHALLEQGHADSCASRCYYAAFHAVRAALIHAGVGAEDQRWSHEGIQGDLSQLTQRRKLYKAHLLDHLRILQEYRLIADYHARKVSLRAARRAEKMAEEFVSAVKKVIHS